MFTKAGLGDIKYLPIVIVVSVDKSHKQTLIVGLGINGNVYDHLVVLNNLSRRWF